MRRIAVVACLTTLLAACASGTSPKVASRVTVASSGPLAATAKPTAPAAQGTTRPGAALDASRQAALVAAIENTVAASRASKVGFTMSSVSGVLSNNTAGLLANNAGNLLSDGGGSLIANNGGGLTGKTKYRVMDAATGDASATDVVDTRFDERHFTSETSNLVYVVDVNTARTGGFKAYQKDLYHSLPADQLSTALVDDFVWDDVEGVTPFNGDDTLLAMDYHLKKVSSKRLPFVDRLVSRDVLRIVPNSGGVETDQVGMQLEFSLDVNLAGGAQDHASFKSVAEEQDLDKLPGSDGDTLVIPVRLTMTGQNAHGTYTGTIENKDTGTLQTQDKAVQIRLQHHAADGTVTEVAIETSLAGEGQETLDLAASHLSLALTYDAQGLGKGTLNDTASGTPAKLGDVSWDASGLGTITLADGTRFQAQLF